MQQFDSDDNLGVMRGDGRKHKKGAFAPSALNSIDPQKTLARNSC